MLEVIVVSLAAGAVAAMLGWRLARAVIPARAPARRTLVEFRDYVTGESLYVDPRAVVAIVPFYDSVMLILVDRNTVLVCGLSDRVHAALTTTGKVGARR